MSNNGTIDVPSLSLSVPVIHGSVPVEHFHQHVTEYRRSITRSGGYYEASWKMPLSWGLRGAGLREAAMADPDITTGAIRGNHNLLRRWFEAPYLMYHVEERAAGAVTWEGVVWELELTMDGLTRRVSMDDVWNAVRTDYTDTAGAPQHTAWYTDDESISLFGRKEIMLEERYTSPGEAVAAAQSFLAEYAWPQPKVTEINSTQKPGMFVQAVGYCVTANFQYVLATSADGETGNISTFIDNIVANDCEFLQAGNIETNTLQRKRAFDRRTRCWDAIEELAEMGDASNNPWLATVYNERRLNYEAADNTPTLHWDGPRRRVTNPAGDINAWHVRPGVMRDMTGLITTARPTAFLAQPRDIWVDEVEMSQGREQPIFKPDAFDPLAIIRAQQQYLDWMESEDA